MINVLDGIFLVFFTPEQGGKFKMPVAHTCLIKVESPQDSEQVETDICAACHAFTIHMHTWGNFWARIIL